ncbi:uracil-xanthine permease family protein [Legionella gresilensis]|uniref:uracil-xanthine permease family protein n=1 Tax=Legionella gresilensis TaxID=91823 RepID=UPI00104128C8|nr:solute carrier family 23 protein [Legionella gresilensis]
MNNDELIYGVNDKPPFVKLCLLAIQYVVLMSVYLVLIVIVVKAAHLPYTTSLNAVRMGMIALAIATSIQALKPPIGSGYLAAPVVSAIYLKASLLAATAGGLPLVLGMTIFSGLMEIFFSRFIYQLRAFFPPGISGFIISIVGIELGLEGLAQFLELGKEYHYASLTKHIFIALLTLGIMVGLSIWWRGIIKLICSFVGLVVGYIVAFLLGVVHTNDVNFNKVPFFAWPDLTFISYDFSFSLILPFFIASIAAALRTVGVITTCQKINDPSWKKPDLKSIKGGVFADGLGAVVAGICGIPGISTGPSLVGVSNAAGATSRYIAFAASIVLILMALQPKFALVLLIVPMSVIGPALMFTGSFMVVGGIALMSSKNIDMRMTYVIGLALLFGLSREIYPNFYDSLPPILQTFTCTSLTLSVIIALFLHLIFRIGIRKQAVLNFNENMSNIKLNRFILEHGQLWKIDKQSIERIALTTEAIIQHLHYSNLATNSINLTLTYDQIDVVVEVQYEGDLLLLPFVNQKKRVFIEEESFSYGLSDFLIGVYPDKLERFTSNNLSYLKLYFHI